MKLTLALLLFTLMLGCATPMTEAQLEEREYERAERAEMWRLCEQVYQQAGKPVYSEHSHSKSEPHRPWQITDDLWKNNCHTILKKMGLWE